MTDELMHLQYTVILAFDVKVERDAQEMADNMGVKIFQVGGEKCQVFRGTL